jgi:hypothetical protein
MTLSFTADSAGAVAGGGVPPDALATDSALNTPTAAKSAATRIRVVLMWLAFRGRVAESTTLDETDCSASAVTALSDIGLSTHLDGARLFLLKRRDARDPSAVQLDLRQAASGQVHLDVTR